jgi:uncharacterized protein YlxW (UPF0749 family)
MSEATGRRRPDASMTLLTEVMQRPLDPGYAAAAAQRDRDATPGRARRRAPVTTVLAVVAGALLASAVLDLRLPSLLDERGLLVERVEVRTTEVDVLEERVAALQVEVDTAGSQALAGRGSGAVEEAERLGVLAGSTPVVGPGVEITLDDASDSQDPVAGDPGDESTGDDGRVVDRDVVVVVNGLWAAGAESVSVNGQRLTSLSAIRGAGDAILVSFRPLAPPYRIVAVGDPQGLQTGFASSAAGRYLASIQQNYGVRASISAREEVELPGARGLRLRYARPPEPATASPPSTRSPTSPPPTDQEVAP